MAGQARLFLKELMEGQLYNMAASNREFIEEFTESQHS